MHFQLSSAKCRPFCLGLDILRVWVEKEKQHLTPLVVYSTDLKFYIMLFSVWIDGTKLEEIKRNNLPGMMTISCKSMQVAWWRHQMETFSALLAICAGNSPVPVNSPHQGQWRGDLRFSLICARINGWVNTGEAGDLRRHRAHYDVIVMEHFFCFKCVQFVKGSTILKIDKGNHGFWHIRIRDNNKRVSCLNTQSRYNIRFCNPCHSVCNDNIVDRATVHALNAMEYQLNFSLASLHLSSTLEI